MLFNVPPTENKYNAYRISSNKRPPALIKF